MFKILTCVLSLICLTANAQYFSLSDFHSDFERNIFDQVTQKNLIDPSSFLVAADKDNDLEDYKNLSLQLRSIPAQFENSKYEKMDFEKKLKKIFQYTQKKYFKSYKLYNSYTDLLVNGQFNCISGTAFYALLLMDMGYKIHIYETPHHAYLEVEAEDGSVILIESTDAAFGVVDKKKKIETRREEYAQGISEYVAKGLGNVSKNPEEIFTNEIDIIKLAGLQYYNEAVKAFNDGEFEKASTLLKKASYLYPSSRIITLQLLSEKLIAANY